MRIYLKPLLACLVAALFLAPAAAAHKCGTVAPPGTSGVGEYLETIPGICGNRPAIGPGATTGGGGGAPTLSQHVVHQLTGAGATGKAALGAIERSGPGAPAAAVAAVSGSTSGSRSGASSGGTESGPAPPPPASGSAVSAVGHALSGSGGAGILFPLVLIACLLAVVVGRIAHNRSRSI